MLPEEAKPPDPEPFAKSEETQPNDSPKEDPDKIRRIFLPVSVVVFLLTF